jgi:hypothetical protein
VIAPAAELSGTFPITPRWMQEMRCNSQPTTVLFPAETQGTCSEKGSKAVGPSQHDTLGVTGSSPVAPTASFGAEAVSAKGFVIFWSQAPFALLTHLCRNAQCLHWACVDGLSRRASQKIGCRSERPAKRREDDDGDSRTRPQVRTLPHPAPPRRLSFRQPLKTRSEVGAQCALARVKDTNRDVKRGRLICRGRSWSMGQGRLCSPRTCPGWNGAGG